MSKKNKKKRRPRFLVHYEWGQLEREQVGTFSGLRQRHGCSRLVSFTEPLQGTSSLVPCQQNSADELKPIAAQLTVSSVIEHATSTE